MIAPVLFTQVFAAAIERFHALGLPGAPFLLAALLLVPAVVAVRPELGGAPDALRKGGARGTFPAPALEPET